MSNDKLNIIIPQWQGGGQDLCTYHGAFALKENYAGGTDFEIVDISTEDIGAVVNGILGYEDIKYAMDDVGAVLKEKDPSRIFTIGGGCDADIPCAAYLNMKNDGNMAIVYIDAHGDLNLPETSPSKMFYGMSLRALMGDGDKEIVGSLAKAMDPKQLIMCAGRDLDPEEQRYIKENGVTTLDVDELSENPWIIGEKLRKKGYKSAYIHVDLDCLDPDEFPLVPLHEPDGLSCITLLEIVRSVASECELKGLAIMEYCGDESDKGNELLEELVKIGLDM